MTTLHFIHVGKTGGTAVKRGLRRAGLAYWKDEDRDAVPATQYGPIQLHNHRFHMADVPEGDYGFFCVRDPIARFMSGFYSRLNKGQPAYYYEWTKRERRAFEAFPTPQGLVAALGGEDEKQRRRARQAMRDIHHLRPMERFTGSPEELEEQLDKVAYIARQETLRTDWEQLKELLELPARARLPSNPARSHRRGRTVDTELDAEGIRTLKAWYARDYRLLEYCDRLRAARGWGTGAELANAGR